MHCGFPVSLKKLVLHVMSLDPSELAMKLPSDQRSPPFPNTVKPALEPQSQNNELYKNDPYKNESLSKVRANLGQR